MKKRYNCPADRSEKGAVTVVVAPAAQRRITITMTEEQAKQLVALLAITRGEDALSDLFDALSDVVDETEYAKCWRPDDVEFKRARKGVPVR